MKEFSFKMFILLTSAAMLFPIYYEIGPASFLEHAGLIALMFIPFRYLTRINYKHWKEL